MPKYRILLNGRNFWMNLENTFGRFGFFTWRYVEAPTPEEAERLAVDVVRGEETLRSAALNASSDPPTIYVEEIDELESFDGITPPGARSGMQTWLARPICCGHCLTARTPWLSSARSYRVIGHPICSPSKSRSRFSSTFCGRSYSLLATPTMSNGSSPSCRMPPPANTRAGLSSGLPHDGL